MTSKIKSPRPVAINTGFQLLFYLLFSPLLVWAEVADLRIDSDTPPGRMIDIGTHHLHLHCIGENQPTVIIDSGLGGFSLEWLDIQHNLATQMRICSYDRAGYGWSETGPSPRTTAQIVEELYWMLDMADEQGPFILVGHSFGGYTMQRFAALYPELTAAVVLVDSSHPNQHVDFPVIASTVSKRSAIPPQQARMMRRRMLVSNMTVLPKNYPVEVASTAIQLMMYSKSMRAQQQELQFFYESARDVLEAGEMPDVELVIMTRGRNAWPNNSEGQRKEKIWQKLQQSFLLKNHHHARQIIAANSGHHIHLDQPELFEHVIRGLVADVCEPDKLALYAETVDGFGEC